MHRLFPVVRVPGEVSFTSVEFTRGYLRLLPLSRDRQSQGWSVTRFRKHDMCFVLLVLLRLCSNVAHTSHVSVNCAQNTFLNDQC